MSTCSFTSTLTEFVFPWTWQLNKFFLGYRFMRIAKRWSSKTFTCIMHVYSERSQNLWFEKNLTCSTETCNYRHMFLSKANLKNRAENQTFGICSVKFALIISCLKVFALVFRQTVTALKFNNNSREIIINSLSNLFK